MQIDFTVNLANLAGLVLALFGFLWGIRKVLVKLYVLRQEEHLRTTVRELKKQQGAFLLGGFVTYSAVELGRQRQILERVAPKSHEQLVMQDMAMNMIACYSLLIARLVEDFPEFRGLGTVAEANLDDFRLDLAIERSLRVSNALRFFAVADDELAQNVRNGRACALGFCLGSDLLKADDLYDQCRPGFRHLLEQGNDCPPAEEVRAVLEAFAAKNADEVDRLIAQYNRGKTLSDTIQHFSRFLFLCGQGHRDAVARASGQLRKLRVRSTLAEAV